jgi:hypothetical protein
MVFPARFSTVCPCCNTRIKIGTQVVWFKGTPAKHFTCPTQTTKSPYKEFPPQDEMEAHLAVLAEGNDDVQDDQPW